MLADADASSIGLNLYGKGSAQPLSNDKDDAVVWNSAWSGALGFNLLGGSDPFESWRLLMDGGDTKETAKVDTLDDFKNILFAVDSYQLAYKAGFDAAGLDFVNYVAASTYAAQTGQWPTDNAGPLAAQFAIMFSSGDFLGLVKNVAARTPIISPVVNTIVEVGANKFLDMLMGATQGKNLFGTTRDSNFASNAANFFNSYGTTLQSTGAKLLDTSSVAILALSDTADGASARAALVALSYVRVDVSSTVADQLKLNDTSNSQGITSNWIQDRSFLLSALITRTNQSSTAAALNMDGTPSDRALQFQWYGADPLPGELLPRLATLTVKNANYSGSVIQKIAFGDDGANALTGTDSILGDHLYGGGGADTLNGLTGNDYLEGGAGDDTYTVELNGGQDTILDEDGQGHVVFAGRTLNGAVCTVSTAAVLTVGY